MAALTALAIGSAVATVAGGISSYQQGKSAQDTAKQQANVAIAKGNIERFQQKQESERIRKTATANAGRGGGSLSGSMLENLNDSMTNAQLDAEMITYNAKTQANAYIQEGRNARAAGTAALIGSIGSAATSMAGSGLFSSTSSITPTSATGSLMDSGSSFPSLNSLMSSVGSK